jgi:hypothetical protein
MTDHSLQGPFTIPGLTLQFQGVWLPTTAYVVGDFVSALGNLYEVPFAHTSAATFDPNATDGHGHNLYSLVLQAPTNGLPAGGVAGQAIVKTSSVDFAATWESLLLSGMADVLLSSLAGGDFLTYDVNSPIGWKNKAFAAGEFLGTGTDGHPLWAVAPSQLVLGNYSFTVADGDRGNYYRVVSGTDVTFTIPANSSEAITVNTEFPIYQASSGIVVTIDGGAVTLNVPDGFQAKLRGKGAAAKLKKTNTDFWDLTGDLLPAVNNIGTGVAGTIPIDPTTNTFFTFTPGGALTVNAIAAPPFGKEITILIKTAGTSSYAVSFNTFFRSQGNLSTGTVAAMAFVIKFVSDGTILYETSRTVAM